jgi:hypothetical protein
MPCNLSHQNQIMAATNKIAQAGVAQDMGRYFQVCIDPKLTQYKIDGTGRESPPLQTQKQPGIGEIREVVLQKFLNSSK